METSGDWEPSQASELEFYRKRVAALEAEVFAWNSTHEQMALQMEGSLLLADAMVEAARALTVEDLCHQIGKSIRTLEPDSCVTVSLYHPAEKRFRATSQLGFDHQMVSALQALRMDPATMRPGGILDQTRSAQYASGRLERMEGGLYEFFSGRIPQAACATLASATGIADIYNVAFTIDDVPYGGMTIMLRHKAGIRHVKPIEALAGYAALAMRERLAVDTVKESETALRTSFEQSMDAIYVSAPDGSYVDANAAWQDLFGYTRDEMQALQAVDFYVDPADRTRFLGAVAKTGHLRDEVRLRKKDGTVVDCIRSVVARRDECGNVIAYQSVARDVTEQKRAMQSLEDSEERYRLLADNTIDVIWRMDTNTVLTYVNPAIETVLGFKPEEWVGSRLADHAPPQFTEPIKRIVVQGLEHIQTNAEVNFEAVMLHKNGATVPLEIHGKIITDEQGRPIALQGVARDISRRKKAEEELRQSQRKTALRNRIGEIFLTSPDEDMYGEVLQVILEAMDSPCGVFGYVDENGALVCPSMTGDIWEHCRMPEKNLVFPMGTWSGLWGRALEERRSLYLNEGLNLPEGHVPLSRVLDVPLVHRSELIGNLLVGNKATDYDEGDREFLESIAATIAPILHARLLAERAQAALQTSGEQMSHLAQRLEEVREEERTNLARELHDTAGQAITALKLDVSKMKKRLEQGITPSVDELDTLDSVLDQTANDVRRVSSELRPGVLDDIGLEGAIEWQLDELRKRSPINFTVNLPNYECWIDDARRTIVFRVFQELITNVIRHAKANSVHVTLEHVDDVCILTMTDDGCGIDMENLEDSKSLGIVGMRERLRPFGGTLDYHGAIPHGTIARAIIPYA